MKRILLALLLFVPLAAAQTFQVQPQPVPITVVCPTGSATVAGFTFTCPGQVVPQCPSPPGPGPCNLPPGVVNLGIVPFDGSNFPAPSGTTTITNLTPYAYAQLTIPNAPGKLAVISVTTNGSSNAWRQLSVSKTIGDFSKVVGQGQTASAYLAIGTAQSGAVTVQVGEVWYLMERNQLPSGGSSCTTPDCNMVFRAYPPN